VGEVPAEAVELPDNEHVVLAQDAQTAVEPRPVVPDAGREVVVDVDCVDAGPSPGRRATGRSSAQDIGSHNNNQRKTHQTSATRDRTTATAHQGCFFAFSHTTLNTKFRIGGMQPTMKPTMKPIMSSSTGTRTPKSGALTGFAETGVSASPGLIELSPDGGLVELERGREASGNSTPPVPGASARLRGGAVLARENEPVPLLGALTGRPSVMIARQGIDAVVAQPHVVAQLVREGEAAASEESDAEGSRIAVRRRKTS